MARILYDLTASGDRRFSPYCWRTKLALAHKGLDYETVATRFTDIDALSDGPRLTLPVLDDGDTRIVDSWAIAEHLEAQHTNQPPLFPGGKAHARFITNWTPTIHPPLLRLILLDVFKAQDAENQAYFRPNREAKFGMTLEAFVEDHDAHLKGFRAALSPIRETLKSQAFLAGDTPAYANYIPAGAFLWAEAISDCEIVASDDPVAAWMQRVKAVLN